MSAKTRAELVLVGATIIWGTTFTILKIAMAEISPVTFAALRFIISTLILFVLFRRKIFPLPRAAALKGSLLGIFLFVGFVTQNIGLTITTASKSAFITGMMVVFVPLLQIVIERRPPRIGNLLGALIVGAGLWFLTSPAGSSFNTGDALTLVCSVVFAIYIVYLDVISREMTEWQLTFLQMISTALLATSSALLFEDIRIVLTPGSIVALLYLTLVATLLTTVLQTRFQKDTTPTRAVIIFSMEPVVAAFVANRVLGEHLGTLGLLGGACIVVGVLLSEVSDGIPYLNRPMYRENS